MLVVKGMTPNKNRRVTKHKSTDKLWLAMGIIAIIIIVVAGYAVFAEYSNKAATIRNEYSDSSAKVLLHTTAGDITLELRNDKPITTANFVNIVNQGRYNGSMFYRVIARFMIQGGNITKTVPAISDEIGNDNRNVAYTIAMAKTSSPNSATSEFFINVADNGNNPIDAQGTKFDSVYTVFGKVISGQKVVDAIANAQVTKNNIGEISQPVNPVTIISATSIS
jgi:peptidyl-prolyl cis-trans isomerase A (cyclophilin A)/peptidyl-prolyl cis-trans isomerase B (cyclophilin B)